MDFPKTRNFHSDPLIIVKILFKTPFTSFGSFPSGKKAFAKFINSFMVAFGGVLYNRNSAVAALNNALKVGSIRPRCHESFNDLLVN